jgi:predicted metal-dependent enzyme (double-stranded beta helix superfamily)
VSAIDPVKVASLRGESSNQLFETLEEWNDSLERLRARNAPGTINILNGRCWKVSNEFPGIFSGYHVSAQISASDLRASC